MPVAIPTAEISKESLPKVQSLDANTSSLKDMVEALKETGGVIIRNMVPEEDIKKIHEEIRELVDNDVPWEGSFFPTQTRRVMGLVGKSPTSAKWILDNKIYWDISRVFLEDVNWFWNGSEKQWCVSSPQLNTSIAFSINPGATAQGLHRDDHIHHNQLPAIEAYPKDLKQRETLIGIFIAVKPATDINGATRFIPGSHLWDKEQEPSVDLSLAAELNPGDGKNK